MTFTERLLCARSRARLQGFREEWHIQQSVPWGAVLSEALRLVGETYRKPLSGHCNASKCRGSLRSLNKKVKNSDWERIWETTFKLRLLLPFLSVYLTILSPYCFSVQRRSGRNWRERKWWKDCWWPNCEILPLVPGGWHGAFCPFSFFGLCVITLARHTNVCSVGPGLCG